MYGISTIMNFIEIQFMLRKQFMAKPINVRSTIHSFVHMCTKTYILYIRDKRDIEYSARAERRIIKVIAHAAIVYRFAFFAKVSDREVLPFV